MISMNRITSPNAALPSEVFPGQGKLTPRLVAAHRQGLVTVAACAVLGVGSGSSPYNPEDQVSLQQAYVFAST